MTQNPDPLSVDLNLTNVKRKYFHVIVLLIFASCGGAEKEDPSTYYDRFTGIIVPYKEGTESILTQIQGALKEQMKASGDFRLSPEDSIRQEELIKEFSSLAKQTIDSLRGMNDMHGSELKSAGVRYVQQTSESVLAAYHNIVLPLQDPVRRPSQHTIDSLSEKYSDQLVRSNEDFASRQLEFLQKTGLLSL